MNVPFTGMPFKEQKLCERCNAEAPYTCDVECFCGAQDALAELVELKRMKDAGGVTPEYGRRKAIAWREAFRACGVVGEPKP